MVDQDKIFPFSSGDAYILIRHVSGRVVSQSGNFGKLEFPYKDEIQKILSGADSSYTTLGKTNIPNPEADQYRLITFPLDNDKAPQLFLQIAVPMTTFETQLESLSRIISIGLPALLILSIVLGLYFSSRALRPVQELIRNTNKVGINNLSDRVPLPQARDEIRTLAETQNLMLDRIEKSFQSQERFVADASHQLLTPLTILRGEVEIRLKSDTQNSDFLRGLLQEIDNLSKIVQDMLLLARIDAGGDRSMFRDIDISEVLLEVIERVQKIIKEKKLHLKFDIEGVPEKKTVFAEPDLVFNMLFNIIENAAKYSTEGQSLYVRLTYTSENTILDIADNGVGIPDDKIATIFDRFSRLNPSGKTKGFGLGLAIAKKIAEFHNFELSALRSYQAKLSQGAHFVITMKNSITNNPLN